MNMNRINRIFDPTAIAEISTEDRPVVPNAEKTTNIALCQDTAASNSCHSGAMLEEAEAATVVGS
jgi:hypothetical protein